MTSNHQIRYPGGVPVEREKWQANPCVRIHISTPTHELTGENSYLSFPQVTIKYTAREIERKRDSVHVLKATLLCVSYVVVVVAFFVRVQTRMNNVEQILWKLVCFTILHLQKQLLQ